jgi:hypothetical protein
MIMVVVGGVWQSMVMLLRGRGLYMTSIKKTMQNSDVRRDRYVCDIIVVYK